MEGKDLEKLDTVEGAGEVSAELQEAIKTEAEILGKEASPEQNFTPEVAWRLNGRRAGYLGASALALFLSMPGTVKAADTFTQIFNTSARVVENIYKEQRRAEDAQRRAENEKRKIEVQRERDRLRSEVELEREQQRTKQQEIREGAGVAREQIKERGGLNRERSRKGQPIPAESRSETSGPFGNTSSSAREGQLGNTSGGAEVNPEVKKALMDAGRVQAEEDYKANSGGRRFVKADAHPSWTQGYVTRWLELKEMEKSKK